MFLAVKKEMSRSRRSYVVTKSSGRVVYVSRQLTTFRNLGSSLVVRIPFYFEEKGTAVCETCWLGDRVLEIR